MSKEIPTTNEKKCPYCPEGKNENITVKDEIRLTAAMDASSVIKFVPVKYLVCECNECNKEFWVIVAL